MKYAVLIVGGLLVLAIPAQAAHRAESESQTIRLVSKALTAKVTFDRPPKGSANKGDQVTVTSRLTNAVAQFGRPKGAVVGSDLAVITIVSYSALSLRQRIRAAVKLPGGTIRIDGVTTESKRTVPVVGGTGAFARARGTCEIRDLEPDGDPALNIYRLRLP